MAYRRPSTPCCTFISARHGALACRFQCCLVVPRATDQSFTSRVSQRQPDGMANEVTGVGGGSQVHRRTASIPS
ncbi:unnamed protein product [Closterium sp. NIES-65]|nr:unnamed protein product [Closterium sp. NIES-65]